MMAPSLPRLTPREQDILDAVLAGASNKVIAAKLGLTEQTVKNRLTSLYRKLGVTTRLELALLVVNKHA
jgi:two-component system nitrate/nitrite response regulator NarL